MASTQVRWRVDLPHRRRSRNETGIEYLKKALEQANDTTGVPKIKEDDDAWWMHEDLFNEYPSFAESILLDAVREVLDKEPEGADKRVPFPREGQNLQSEDYIIVGDIVQSVIEGTDARAGQAVGAARKMGRSHQDHAKLTLAHAQKNGRSVWCPVKQNTPITSATMVRLNPGEEPVKDAIVSRVYPGWQLVKRKTPVHDAVLVLRDFIFSQKKHDDPIMEIAPYFLSACGDYTGTLRMVAFDRDADRGNHPEEDDPYKFSVANPNFKAQGGAKNGFKASTMIRSNPLARRERFPMKQGQARLFYDKTSKIEEQTFVDLAVALGLDRAEAIIMSKRFTISAMMKRPRGCTPTQWPRLNLNPNQRRLPPTTWCDRRSRVRQATPKTLPLKRTTMPAEQPISLGLRRRLYRRELWRALILWCRAAKRAAPRSGNAGKGARVCRRGVRRQRRLVR